jgi:hypothetical protein
MKIEVSNEYGKVFGFLNNNENKDVLIEKTKHLMRKLPKSELYDIEIY